MSFHGSPSVVGLVGITTALVASASLLGQSPSDRKADGPNLDPHARAASDSTEQKNPPSLAEARERAKLLHEAYEAALVTIHRQYFREGKGMPVPSRALEDVFHRVARRSNVEARWIAVNAQAMSIEHNPRDDFEKAAVRSLDAGQESYELLEHGTYRRAAAVTLFADCIKCHTSQTRAPIAGLVITMPVAMSQ